MAKRPPYARNSWLSRAGAREHFTRRPQGRQGFRSDPARAIRASQAPARATQRASGRVDRASTGGWWPPSPCRAGGSNRANTNDNVLARKNELLSTTMYELRGDHSLPEPALRKIEEALAFDGQPWTDLNRSELDEYDTDTENESDEPAAGELR